MKLGSPLIAGFAAVLALGAFVPALAASDTEALHICKTEVTARYGEQAQTKVQRIRKRGDTTSVQLYVRGVGERSFKVECKVDDNLQLSGFIDKRAKVAAR